MTEKLLTWKAVLLLLIVALLLMRVPRMLAAIANNRAALALVEEWQGVVPSRGLPRCQTQLETSAAERYWAPAMIWEAESRSTLLNRGRAAWNEGNCSDAREIWEQVMRFSPADSISAFWLFWLVGGTPEVVPEALDAKGLARFADGSGRQAEDEGATDAAISWLELSLSLEPTRSVAGRLAALYHEKDRPQDADAVLERLIGGLAEEDADYWWAIGQVAELETQWAKAAQAYNQGAELAEDPYEFRIGEAAALEKLGDWSVAETAYRAALEARPDLMWPYLRLGLLRHRAGDAEGALAWFRQAQAADPGSSLPSFYTGVLLFDQGAVSKAQAYFEKALEFDPNHVESVFYLSQSLHRGGQAEEAVSLLAQAVAMQGGQRWHWAVELGDWRLALGDREGALADYHQALEWNPGDGSILKRLEDLEGDEN